MDRLISQFEVIRAIEKYVDNIFTKNMGDLIKDIKAISVHNTCEGCVFNTEFVHGCSACQQCSRFYSDMYTVRRDKLG